MPTIYARKYKIKSQRNESEIPKLRLSLKFILNDTKHGIKKFFFYIMDSMNIERRVIEGRLVRQHILTSPMGWR